MQNKTHREKMVEKRSVSCGMSSCVSQGAWNWNP
jgi:hypothetical protein